MITVHTSTQDLDLKHRVIIQDRGQGYFFSACAYWISILSQLSLSSFLLFASTQEGEPLPYFPHRTNREGSIRRYH